MFFPSGPLSVPRFVPDKLFCSLSAVMRNLPVGSSSMLWGSSSFLKLMREKRPSRGITAKRHHINEVKSGGWPHMIITN